MSNFFYTTKLDIESFHGYKRGIQKYLTKSGHEYTKLRKHIFFRGKFSIDRQKYLSHTLWLGVKNVLKKKRTKLYRLNDLC